jgi:chromate transporter
MDPLQLFVDVLKAATLSVGGLSSLPLLRQELGGHVSETQVIEALAIGRLSTGPNGLFVVSLGYFALGWLGAGIALLAAAIPPLSLVVAASFVRRWLVTPWAAGIVRGVALSTSGLVLATGIQLIQLSAGGPATRTPWAGVDLWSLLLAAIAAVLTLQGKVHPGLLVIGGAVAGIALEAL